VADTKTKARKKKGDPFAEHGVSEELGLELLRDMLLYRRFEEKTEEG